ncbi:molybdopterin synthase catalytic subunit [Desulfobaculum xiamenense]|uniref:Molybdopterin synthase catalytic subunit n=1 Tax=Desulfobaculum xiamenense TaxID=995050 RepID=A0A846QK87_9BACT|nr:molybdenum cofactor biosynthesis protein MoaE [Desulfobaculum xiamenense]NJB67470.1 molybdopterin synthase catalytic subunit [Desulfobaculum xiamenense]
MDITRTIAELKKDPEFAKNVGMLLCHNGVVRATSRADGAEVTGVTVQADQAMIDALCAEYEQRPGIWKCLAEGRSGCLKPGDDLLFIIVAGDFRENVKTTLAELLDRIKSEAVKKTEDCVR